MSMASVSGMAPRAILESFPLVEGHRHEQLAIWRFIDLMNRAQIGWQSPDGDGPLKLRVFGAVDGTHATAADLFQN
jgi:hypothetical protein